MTRNTRATVTGLVFVAAVAVLVTAATATGWPFAHTFATYTWPGPFGWVATNTPGNMVAGFLQVGIGVMIGYGLKKTGVIERAKQWAMRDLHAHLAELHDKADELQNRVDHVIYHHPDIPEYTKQESAKR